MSSIPELESGFALNFKSAKNVIQMDDKESGKIITKGLHEDYYIMRILGSDGKYPFHLHFTLNIALKDEKFRVQVSDYEVEYPPSSFGTLPTQKAEKLIVKLQKANSKIKSGNRVGNNERKSLYTYQQMLDIAYNLGKNETASIKKAVVQPSNSEF